MVRVWAARGAPETLAKLLGKQSPPRFGKVFAAFGAVQTPHMTDFRLHTQTLLPC